MTGDAPPVGGLAGLPVPPRLQGLAACRAALRDSLLALAPASEPQALAGPGPQDVLPPHRVLAIDRDFAAWPFDEPDVLQALARWLRQPSRRLVLIGTDFDTTALRLPRFTRWRRDLVHRIDCWRPVDGLIPEDQRGLLAGDFGWRWLDTRDAQLQGLTDRVQRQAFEVGVADFLQRCEPAWPVTTLGL